MAGDPVTIQTMTALDRLMTALRSTGVRGQHHLLRGQRASITSERPEGKGGMKEIVCTELA